MTQNTQTNTAFLTVDEAAARLGTSRLRVREAVARGLLASRRDNEGRLRVDLPDSLRLPTDAVSDLAPDDIVTFLFDDIEELEVQLGERDAQITRLITLVEGQDAALGESDAKLTEARAALEKVEAQNTKMSQMLDQALAHLEAGAAEARDKTTKLTDVSDRALQALGAAVTRAETGEAQTQRMGGLLERAMTLAEDGQSSHAVTDKALGMLDAALLRAEAAQVSAAKAEAATERAREALARREAALADREKQLQASLDLSERAAALATSMGRPDRPRRGFLRRLLGI